VIIGNLYETKKRYVEELYILLYNAVQSVENQPTLGVLPKSNFALPVTCFMLFLTWLILLPRRWWRHIPPKCRLIFKGVHGVLPQKIEIFLNVAMRTSNPTRQVLRDSVTNVCLS
jgi:hypothetical protein